MEQLEIERRADGSLLLTARGRARRGTGVAGLVVGALLLVRAVTVETTLLGSVVMLPLGLIVLLTGLAALRHRDWILVDRPARQIAYRRGLASIFRAVRTLGFDDVDAIVIEEAGLDDSAVQLRIGGDLLWPVDRSPDPVYVTGLAAALHDAGGWPVWRGGTPAHPGADRG